MEDVERMWSSENLSLEPLQPLPFSLLDDQEESINLDKLSRSEIAGKLLDHLDQIAERQETEPFDWFTNEKPIDLPFFENFSSSIPAVAVAAAAAAAVQHTNVKVSLASSRYPYLDSPEYETPCTPTNQRVYEESTDVSATTQPQVTCVPSLFNADFFSANVNDLPASVNAAVSPVAIPPSPQFVNCNPKGEVLTPPDSPKDEEILELLQKLINDERSENVVPSSVSVTASSGNVAADTGAHVTDNTRNFDEVSDDTASSPYVGSECSSDNDADYVPASRASRRASAGVQIVGARRRASKPYSRHSAEERKLRKKEQNKNAATRYRMKKKQEVEECKNEEQRLADRNRELRNKLDDISREIKCLKSLMRDVYRKKGLIK